MAVPGDEDLRKLVEQHKLAWGMLLGEVGVAFDKTLAGWAEECPDPMRLQGGTLCHDVRTRVLLMNGLDAGSRLDKTPRTPPPGASCGPGSTLKMTSGPGVSVRLGDTKKVAWARLRHMSAKQAEELGALAPEPMPEPKPGKQMAFDATEMDSDVMGPAGIGDQYEFVAYWFETPGRLSVAGGILAMVADIDTSEERVLAFYPLPAAIRPKSAAERPQREIADDDDEDLRDFEEHLPPPPPSDTGDSEA